MTDPHGRFDAPPPGRERMFNAPLTVVLIGYLLGVLHANPVLAENNSQVAARVSPKLIDLIAALATGVVGAFALVRSDVSDTLPGVAIAISLVPPLAVVGLTLESGAPDEALGALLAVLDRLSKFGFVNRRAEWLLAGEHIDRLNVRTPGMDRSVANLSGGNQQKVVLARWLARDCEVLVLDEPTRGVDVGAKAEIYAIIDELAQQQVAVLLISSELPEVLGLADRIVVMESGRVTGELDAAEATEEAILALAMASDLEGASN